MAVLKAWVKAPGNAEDTLLTTLCMTARMMAERITGRAIPKQEFIAYHDCAPGRYTTEDWDGVRDGAVSEVYSRSTLELPRPPLITVDEVSSFDDDNTETVFAAGNYYVDATDPDMPGRIALHIGASWPVFTRTANGLKVKFTAGYTTVPADITHAIMLIAAYLYVNRGDCTDEGCAGACGAMGFLKHYVMMRT